MDSASKLRRKKRKTRKILNEIRSRLCMQSDKDYGVRSNFDRQTLKVKPRKNCITTNRLTLGLFHKVVRSETITRPDLVKSSKKADLSKSDILDKSTIDNKEDSYDHIDNKEDIYLKNSNNAFDKIECDALEHYQSSSESDSPDSFSSDESQRTTSHLRVSKSTESNVMLTEPLESLQPDDKYQAYEEFIQSLPNVIKRNPTMLREDPMKKTKEYLRNFCRVSCQHGTEDYIMQCIQNNLYNEERERYYTHDFHPKQIFEDDPTSNDKHQGEPKGTLEATTTNTSPVVSISDTTTSSVCSILVPDTPEYIYYPHKLNH